MMRRVTLYGITFSRKSGTKKKPGKWVCGLCNHKLCDGTLRKHVTEKHPEQVAA